MTDAETVRTSILVVDDERPIRTILCDILAKIPGCQVDAAEDGQAAIERLRAEKFARDLVVTDMQMPRMNGEALIMAIRAECPRLPIIVLTAHR
ncbi:MAG: response regulator, partial [Planctomycetota bacterium]|nr:response regulator [Planctomycetota bacterium]